MSAPTGLGPADLLVVDDDPRNRKLLEEYLVAAGHAVRLAPDGRSALAAVHERVPDIVFLDVMMPDISGFEVCRAIKADPATRIAQIVLVTALDGTPHRVEGLDTGADDFISKPVRREEFLAKVRSLLRAHRLLRDLDSARADLASRNRALEEMEALKETLAQTLVHDLKNPLTAVVANLDLLERKLDDGDARHLVGRCRAGAMRMHRMILDLLDVAGLEEGKLLLRLENLDAVSVARRAVEDAEPAARARGLVLALDASAPCPVRADPSVLGRVFDNLLANAIDHSNRGGRVTVHLAPCEEGVSIDVADEGPGIPEEHRERIFEKFARLELRKAGLGGNRGLGLTFCRLAVEAHGGTIWVDAAPGGGALFRTILPAVEGPAAIAAGA